MNAEQLKKLLINCGAEKVVIRNHNVMCCCPWHEESNPSFGVSVEPPHFFGCFSCGVRGVLSRFLIEKAGYSAVEAFRVCKQTQTDKVLPEFERKLVAKARIDHTELFPYKWTKTLTRYCASRGIRKSFGQKLGLVHHTKDCRMLFPWKYQSVLVGVTGRALDDNPVKTLPYFGTKKGDWLFLPHGCITPNRFVLVEGEIDALCVSEAGFGNVGAIGFGNFTDRQKNLMLNSRITELVLCLDDDATGERLSNDVFEKMGKHVPVSKVNYAPYRAGYKNKLDPAELTSRDLQDMLVKVGKYSAWNDF